MSAENPKFWAFADDESYHCKTIEERIEEFHRDCDGHMPETIELLGLDPQVIPESEITKQADWALEGILENLGDSEYSNNNYNTDPTQTMKDAATEFIKKVVAEYPVYWCVEVCRKTVNTSDYITQESAS